MLKVNEIFGPAIQGEGKSAGRQVVFLRTALCNLHCTWCDTPNTWNWKEYDRRRELHEMDFPEVVKELRNIGQETKALVISGGEPFFQQRELVSVIKTFKKLGWWVEIDTNGTISPFNSLLESVDQINCSLKLANNGADSQEKRVRPKAILKLAQSGKANFNFVIVSRSDMDEVLELVSQYELQEVYLMPEGKTKEVQEARQEQIKELCQEFGFNFSPRLHILQGNDK